LNCYALADKKKLKAVRQETNYVINVSKVSQQNYATVIVIDIKGKPIIYDAPEIISPTGIFINQMPVYVKTKIPNAVIRYTLNGDEPILSSPIAKDSIVIKESATVKAKCFLRDKPITETSEASFDQVPPGRGTALSSPVQGLNYFVYEGDWSKLPDFDRLTSVSSGISQGLDISSKRGKEKYGFAFSGLIRIPVEGVYNFFISSDDGSQLFIDDKLVIDNDGLHGSTEKNKEVALAAGFHAIKVLYFQKTGGDDLLLQWQGPGFKKTVIQASSFFREGY
jgi:alpha-L-fucosidase